MTEARKHTALTEAQRKALEWLADRPNGQCLYSLMPENIASTLMLHPRRSILVREYTGTSGFLGLRITKAGRAALAKAQQEG